MHPLIYHLGVDDYFPYEDFEPHRFEHIAAWRRERHGPSLVRRLGRAALHAVRPGRGQADRPLVPQASARQGGEPAIRWA